ncbi:MAG: hypothetical protein IJ137_00820 [Eubacterium sp.]|nr:hypothetical protein [Eubacterium sp.]
MEEGKKKRSGRGIAILLSLILILAGALVIFLSAGRRRYEATITEIVEPAKKKSKTSGSKSNKRKVRYQETVKVKYVDKKGKTQKANVVLTRNTKNGFPKVGEAIKVNGNILKTTEYNPIKNLGTGIALIFVGILLFISAIRFGRKKKEPE